MSAIPTSWPAFTKSEMMIVAAARELAGQRVCFVGVGPAEHRGEPRQADGRPGPRAGLRGRRVRRPAGPAAALASATPRSSPARPRSTSMLELFGFYLQGGLIDVGLPGRRPDRPVRQHQHDRHRRLRPPDDAPARLRRRVRDRDQRPPGVRDHAPERAARSSRRSTSGPRPATSAAPSGRADPARAGLARARAVASWSRTSASTTSTRAARCASTRSTPGATLDAGPRDDRLGRRGRRRRWPRRPPRPPTSCASSATSSTPGGAYTR